MKQYTSFFRPLMRVLTVLTAATFPALAQVPTVPLAQYSSKVVGVATFDPTDLPYRSVLAGTVSGELHEIFYGPTTPQQHGDSIIGYFSGIRAIAGFYAADDHYRIAIVGTTDGNLTEVYYHPYKGRGRSVIANFPTSKIMSIAAYYNPYDHHRIVYVALADSSIWEVDYHPSLGVKKSFRFQYGQTAIGNVLALAANSVAGGQQRRLLVSTHIGNLYEYRLNNQPSIQVLAFTALLRAANPLTSLGTTGNWTVGVSPRLGAGFINGGQMNLILPPGVGFIAADTAGHNYNDFVWSVGSTVYTSNYPTY